MKYFFTLIILCFALSAGITQAQQQETSPAATTQEIKWTRIEIDKKELSVAFPPGFIVDAEKKEGLTGNRTIITGWRNGVRMELHVSKTGDAGERLQRVVASKVSNLSNFTVNGLKGKKISSSVADGRFFEKIFLAGDNHFYFLKVEARNNRKEEIARFLYSIQVKGKPMFVTADKNRNPAEEIVSFADLKTSPEVIEALNRKTGKNQIKVIRELAPLPGEFIPDENYSRPPIVVNHPFPQYRGNITGGSLEATLKINFLANGQIGDITVYSGATDKDFVEACVDAARKIKFIPAQIDGKDADAVDFQEYSIQIYTVTSPGRY
jgi:hypothetical protein